jgi:hypothetical protein
LDRIARGFGLGNRGQLDRDGDTLMEAVRISRQTGSVALGYTSRRHSAAANSVGHILQIAQQWQCWVFQVRQAKASLGLACMSFSNQATHARCRIEGYPDGLGRASDKEGES